MNYDDVPCSTCGGSGYAETFQIPPKVKERLKPVSEPCRVCHGEGTIRLGVMEHPCDNCKGTGEKFYERDGELCYPCPDCNGNGKIKV